MTEKFIMVSLDEIKAKKLAEVISNDTARKILDYLSDKSEATVSEISKNLNIPISTIDYNIKNLIDNGLVESEEFKWSPKGKQMDIYRLANKHIVISTKKNELLMDKLKKVFIMLITGIGITWLINHFYNPVEEPQVQAGLAAVQKAAPEVANYAVTSGNTSQMIQNVALWFLFGVIFATIIYLIIDWRLRK